MLLSTDEAIPYIQGNELDNLPEFVVSSVRSSHTPHDRHQLPPLLIC